MRNIAKAKNSNSQNKNLCFPNIKTPTKPIRIEAEYTDSTPLPEDNIKEMAIANQIEKKTIVLIVSMDFFAIRI